MRVAEKVDMRSRSTKTCRRLLLGVEVGESPDPSCVNILVKCFPRERRMNYWQRERQLVPVLIRHSPIVGTVMPQRINKSMPWEVHVF